MIQMQSRVAKTVDQRKSTGVKPNAPQVAELTLGVFQSNTICTNQKTRAKLRISWSIGTREHGDIQKTYGIYGTDLPQKESPRETMWGDKAN